MRQAAECLFRMKMKKALMRRIIGGGVLSGLLDGGPGRASEPGRDGESRSCERAEESHCHVQSSASKAANTQKRSNQKRSVAAVQLRGSLQIVRDFSGRNLGDVLSASRPEKGVNFFVHDANN